jgi:hypothetical protein
MPTVAARAAPFQWASERNPDSKGDLVGVYTADLRQQVKATAQQTSRRTYGLVIEQGRYDMVFLVCSVAAAAIAFYVKTIGFSSLDRLKQVSCVVGFVTSVAGALYAIVQRNVLGTEISEIMNGSSIGRLQVMREPIPQKTLEELKREFQTADFANRASRPSRTQQRSFPGDQVEASSDKASSQQVRSRAVQLANRRRSLSGADGPAIESPLSTLSDQPFQSPNAQGLKRSLSGTNLSRGKQRDLEAQSPQTPDNGRGVERSPHSHSPRAQAASASSAPGTPRQAD